ncbi:hypothetical protein D3C81_1697720 [compost metagenome]
MVEPFVHSRLAVAVAFDGHVADQPFFLQVLDQEGLAEVKSNIIAMDPVHSGKGVDKSGIPNQQGTQVNGGVVDHVHVQDIHCHQRVSFEDCRQGRGWLGIAFLFKILEVSLLRDNPA